MTDETANTEQSRVAADCPNERIVRQCAKVEKAFYETYITPLPLWMIFCSKNKKDAFYRNKLKMMLNA